MKYLVLALVVLLTSCTTVQHQPMRKCPSLPTIGDDEPLKEYTKRIIIQYNECAGINDEKPSSAQ